ncbi:hypothetical protein RB653_004841 [Dictyostelium firmibasis]|uniref:IlvB-like protein n=1 Tax=Dictyostelium firmibasis TaxID=79012 RepID=A0AAN7Z3N2_9MYCE
MSQDNLIKGVAITASVGSFLLSYYILENRKVIASDGQIFRFEKKSCGGELVANVLSRQGVKFLFTLTGGHIAPILVESDKIGIKVIDVRHESTTVFAADGVFRLTGIPGVAVVTAGPGLTNTITAVKNAQMAQSGVVLLGGATSDLLKGKGSLQDIDQFALLRPHVKWCSHVSSNRDIVPMLERAFYEARNGTPGPVFVEFPIDVLYQESIVKGWYLKNQDQMKSLASRAINFYMSYHLNKIFSTIDTNIIIHGKVKLDQTKVTLNHVQALLEELTSKKSCKKPVLIVGSQVTLINDNYSIESLQRCIQSLGIPVFTSSMSRGLLGTSHSSLFRHCRSHALKNADLVILAGVTCDFRLGYGKSINSRAKVFSINRDPVDLYKNKTPTYPYNLDPGSFLVTLSEAIDELPIPDRNKVQLKWSDWINDLTNLDVTRNIDITNKINVPPASGEGFLNPLKALQMFDEQLPHKTIMVADGGDFVGSASYIVRPRGPLGWLDPGVFGTLGVGAGFSIAAKLCRPDHQVWTIYGDGAFGYSIPELDTMVRHKIAVGAIIGNDSGWIQILREQQEQLHSDVGCNLAYTDYHQVAIAFGGKGFKTTNQSELKLALEESSKILDENQQPVVINCIIERNDFRKGSISA